MAFLAKIQLTNAAERINKKAPATLGEYNQLKNLSNVGSPPLEVEPGRYGARVCANTLIPATKKIIISNTTKTQAIPFPTTSALPMKLTKHKSKSIATIKTANHGTTLRTTCLALEAVTKTVATTNEKNN